MRTLIASVLLGCCACGAAVATASPQPIRPVPGEAFFGDVVALAPPGSATAVFSSAGVAGAPVTAQAITSGTVHGPSGLRGATVVFRDGDGAITATRSTHDAFLLPATGVQAHAGSRRSPVLERALARIAASHSGVTGIWVQRLWDGRAAGWNADAEFPAASTVKLPLGLGAIMRMGPTPWTHPSWPDLTAALRVSDDVAANNLVDRLGSGCATTADSAAAEGLRRLGARQSTFTGCYQTEELQPHLPSGSVNQAPTWSNRHTTARDLGRMLYALHAAAVPTPAARRQTGIPALKARLILGLLLTAVQDGANATLFAGGLPAHTPIAEKNGWREHEQHGAAIAYTRRGPVIMVVLTQRPDGADVSEARRIGAQVARAALRG